MEKVDKDMLNTKENKNPDVSGVNENTYKINEKNKVKFLVY